ncbi:MAG: AraC family transcriptional regulator [Pyrinomonadaceae bacterium]|nr:AraC family transcriptional regulator [Pyrinomonadaceae bacterium]
MSEIDGRVLKLQESLGNGHELIQIIEDSARTFGVSVPYLKKLFKTQTGKTIIQFDNELRLEKARKLFETKYLRISEVCVQVGYGDLSHFVKDFKQKYGFTPKQFQRQCWLKMAK